MIHIVYRELPPSSNHIYFRGTILTKKAREYAERFSYQVTREHLAEISGLNPNGLYALHLRFYFDSLVNESYRNPKVAPSRRAKTRYKKLDLSNRIKLLEDCVRDALSIDDSHTFAASQEKHHDPVDPRVEIFVQEVDPKDFGIPTEEPM